METYRCAPLCRTVDVKQYRLPGDHDQTTKTIRELERGEIIHSAQSPLNSPKCL